MAVGNKTYKGLAVPLYGESEIQQETAATDILTLTYASGGSGDFLVCRTVGGGEQFVIKDKGHLFFSYVHTTVPTTGLVKGDLMVVWKSATHPVLGMCVSTATQLVQYAYGFNADTLGLAAT